MNIDHPNTKRYLFVVLLFCAILFFHSEANAKGVRILESGLSGITMEFCYPEPQIQIKKGKGEEYHFITMSSMGMTQKPGSPQLPIYGTLIAIPSFSDVRLEILEQESEILNDIRVYPAPRRVLITDDGICSLKEEFFIDRVCYSQNRWTPEEPFQINQGGYLRYQRVAHLSICPVQYHPVLQEIRIYKRVILKIIFSECPQIRDRGIPLADDKGDYPPLSEEFERIMKYTVLNYSAVKDQGFSPFQRIIPPRRMERRRELSFDSNMPPIKVSIEEEGLYTISGVDLQAAGWDPAEVIPQNLRMSNKGDEIPINISNEVDGIFHPDDRIRFWGESLNSEFTSTNIYWLYQGKFDGGLRIQALYGPIRPEAQEIDHFTDHLLLEKNQEYWQNIPNGEGKDHWFWRKFSAPSTEDFPFSLHNPANLEAVCTLRLLFQGKTDTIINPDHHLIIYVNGNIVDDLYWDGQIEYLREIPLLNGLLQEGSNKIRIEAPGDTGSSVDCVYLNRIELDYPRLFIAQNNQLFFCIQGEGPFNFGIRGFTEGVISAFDITDPKNVFEIENCSIEPDGASQYRIGFSDTLQGMKRYAILGAGAEKMPVSLEMDQMSDLRSSHNGADYLIITHSDLAESILPLAEYRRSQGLRVEVVKVEEIYDEFSHGIFDPQAIRDFLRHSFQYWAPPAPLYVVLVGDANMDFKDHYGTGRINYVPTHLYPTTELGETPTDNWFVCVHGEDILPDMLIGRIPVRIPEEVQNVTEKIISYEQQDNQPWHQKALFVSGSGTQEFMNIMDDLANKFLPLNFEASRVYLNNYTNMKSAVRDLKLMMSNGCLLTTYCGHGSLDRWASGLFHISNVKDLENLNKPTFLIALTCLNGFFPHPKEDCCLAEELLRNEKNGAIACFASISVGYPTEHRYLSEELFDLIFKQGDANLGVCTTAARINPYVQNKISGDILQTYLLFGDPVSDLKGIYGPMSEVQIPVTPGLNLFCLPGRVTFPRKAADFLEYLYDQGIEAIRMLDYETIHGNWQAAVWQDEHFQGTNFEVLPGRTYLIYTASEEGRYLSLTCSDLYLRYSLGKGFNLVNFPASLGPFFTYDLLEDLGRDYVDSLATYQKHKGKWPTSYHFFGKPAGEKSLIEKNRGYIIRMRNSRDNWRPWPWKN